MKQLKFAWLLVIVLVLSACGQQVPEFGQGPEVDAEIRPLANLSATINGSTTTTIAVNDCEPSNQIGITVIFNATGNQTNPATFTVPNSYSFNGSGWVASTTTTQYTVAAGSGNRAYTHSATINLSNLTANNNAQLTVQPTITNDGGGQHKLSINSNASVNFDFANCTRPNTKPDVTVPPAMTEEATGTSTTVPFEIVVRDAEDTRAQLTVSCQLDGNNVPVTFKQTLSGTHVYEGSVSLGLGTKSVSCTVRDSGGLSDTNSFNITVRDTTEPVISGMPSSQTLEATGPSGAVATWTAPTANDLVDGSVTVNCDANSGDTFPLGSTTVRCTASDAAGNSAAQAFAITVQDTTPPTITWNSSISNGDSFYFGSVPAAPTCTASDLVAGNVSCTVTGYSTALGAQTLTASATDGTNPARETRSYTVLAWTLSGFHSPLSSLEGVLNTAKAGSTVPMKFNVHAGSVEQTATSAITSFRTAKVTCDNTAPTDEVDIVTTGGTSLRYDSTAGQFIQNWRTPKTTGCYRATLTTQDGSTLVALFRLR